MLPTLMKLCDITGSRPFGSINVSNMEPFGLGAVGLGCWANSSPTSGFKPRDSAKRAKTALSRLQTPTPAHAQHHSLMQPSSTLRADSPAMPTPLRHIPMQHIPISPALFQAANFMSFGTPSEPGNSCHGNGLSQMFQSMAQQHFVWQEAPLLPTFKENVQEQPTVQQHRRSSIGALSAYLAMGLHTPAATGGGGAHTWSFPAHPQGQIPQTPTQAQQQAFLQSFCSVGLTPGSLPTSGLASLATPRLAGLLQHSNGALQRGGVPVTPVRVMGELEGDLEGDLDASVNHTFYITRLLLQDCCQNSMI